MLVATFWLAFVVATPAAVAWSATAVLLLAMALLFVVYGSPRVDVEDGWLRAGRARISGEFLGGAEPLDPAATPPGGRPRGRRPRLSAAPPLPQAHGAGDRARRPRPRAVLAGQQPPPRAARRRRHRDLGRPLTADPSGWSGPADRAVTCPHGDDSGSSKLWTVFSVVSALVAAALAKKALDTGWKAATGKHPPENPADPDVAHG